MSPGWVTPQCRFGVPRLLGDRVQAQPHSPIKGGAGAVIDHLTVALHLQIRLAVVTAIILELVDGLREQRVSEAGTSRVVARPGKGREPRERGFLPEPGQAGSAQELQEAGQGERPGGKGPGRSGDAGPGSGGPGRGGPGQGERAGKGRKARAGAERKQSQSREGSGPEREARAAVRGWDRECRGREKGRAGAAGLEEGPEPAGAIPVPAPVPVPLPVAP